MDDADKVTTFMDAMLNSLEKWPVQEMAIDDEVIALLGNLKCRWVGFQVCACRLYLATAAISVGEAS